MGDPSHKLPPQNVARLQQAGTEIVRSQSSPQEGGVRGVIGEFRLKHSKDDSTVSDKPDQNPSLPRGGSSRSPVLRGEKEIRSALSVIGGHEASFALPKTRSSTSLSSPKTPSETPRSPIGTIPDSERIHKVGQKLLQEMLGENPKFPVTLRFNDQKFNLISDEFLLSCPDVIKE